MNLVEFALCKLLFDKCYSKIPIIDIVFMGTWRIGLLFDNDDTLSLYNTAENHHIRILEKDDESRHGSSRFRSININDPLLSNTIDELLNRKSHEKVRIECRSKDIFERLLEIKALREKENQ